MDFSISEKGQDHLKRVKSFMEEEIFPIEEQYHKELMAQENRWVVLPIIKELKAKAKAQGLWNMFFPDEKYGCGLLNSDYAGHRLTFVQFAQAPHFNHLAAVYNSFDFEGPLEFVRKSAQLSEDVKGTAH